MLNYLPIVPKASMYVPKVMHKPVIGGNTVSAPPITGLRITFGTYMEALGTMGR